MPLSAAKRPMLRYYSMSPTLRVAKAEVTEQCALTGGKFIPVSGWLSGGMTDDELTEYTIRGRGNPLGAGLTLR